MPRQGRKLFDVARQGNRRGGARMSYSQSGRCTLLKQSAEILKELCGVVFKRVLRTSQKSRAGSADLERPISGKEFQDLLSKAEQARDVPDDKAM